MTEQQYLFVYGSLRREAAHPMHELLAEKTDFIGKAVFQGQLFRISWYPGAIPSRFAGHKVQGEVYFIRQPEQLLPLLDEYEGCGPAFAEPTEYKRQQKTVMLTSGELLSAWVYLYQYPTSGLPEIYSGDFLE